MGSHPYVGTKRWGRNSLAMGSVGRKRLSFGVRYRTECLLEVDNLEQNQSGARNFFSRPLIGLKVQPSPEFLLVGHNAKGANGTTFSNIIIVGACQGAELRPKWT